MALWLKIVVYPSLVLFCALVGGYIGAWIAARGTEHDTGAAGAADGMAMIMFGLIGFVIGWTVGVVLLFILMAWLKRRKPAAEPAPPQDATVWPPPPHR